MPKKNYEVLVTAYATVLVIGAESEKQALEYATEDVCYGDFQMDEAEVEREVSAQNLEASRKHADAVFEDE
jgi:hypothetical protein